MDYRAFLDWFNVHDAVASSLGIRVTEMGEGYAKGMIQTTDRNRNPMGGLHGGTMASLVDMLAGCAVLYHGRLCVTLDISIRYLKGVRDGLVKGEARELHSGRSTAVSQVELRDEEGALCCVATVTMFLREEPFPMPE